MRCAVCGYSPEAVKPELLPYPMSEERVESFLEIEAAQVRYVPGGYKIGQPVEFSTEIPDPPAPPETIENITIYACPKCGTLKVDI